MTLQPAGVFLGEAAAAAAASASDKHLRRSSLTVSLMLKLTGSSSHRNTEMCLYDQLVR